MTTKRFHAIAASRRQSGIALLVVLLLLIVTSLLGIVVLRSSAMQERMSANTRDRSLALQGAEAALTHAQNTILTTTGKTWDQSKPTITTTDCTEFGVCPNGSADAWKAGPVLGAGDANVPDTDTEYWVEYLGNGPARDKPCPAPDLYASSSEADSECSAPMYRVNARSQSAGRAEVRLQSSVVNRNR